MKGEVAIIVPIKFNSKRVKRKNLRLINGIPLYQYIFSQLIRLDNSWDIFIYSSNVYCADKLDKRIRYLPRPNYLDSDSIHANALFQYSAKLLPHRIQAIVHPTTPFLMKDSMQACIDAVIQGGYDSAFTAEEIKSYAWYKGKPLNYDPYDMVQTQQLEAVLVENSGIYVYIKENYEEYGTRIGGNPYIKVVTKKEALDIDTEEDLKQAKLVSSKHSFDGDEVYSNSEICLKSFPSIDHIVFDFDGVIADTLSVMKRAWSEVAKKLETKLTIPTFERYEEHLGEPFLHILSSIGISKQYWNEIYDLYFKASEKEAAKVELCDGISSFIENLSIDKKLLSIYTSKPRKALEKIQAYQLIKHNFHCILTADELPDGLKGKPSGDGLRYLSEKTCILGTQSLYIGDSYSDALEAKNAEYIFVRACWARINDENYLPNEIISFTPSQIYEVMGN